MSKINNMPRLFFKIMLSSFLVLGLIPVCQAELVDRIVAIINDDIILQSEFDVAANLFRKSVRQQNPDAMDSNILTQDQKNAIINQMINDKLILQQVSQYGIKVNEEEVDSNIERIKSVNNLSDAAMLRMIELDGMTYEEFKTKIKDQLLQIRLVNRQVKSKVIITDAEVRAYYDANKEVFGGRAKYHLRQILVRTASSTTEDEKRSTHSMIQSIYERLKSGEDFSKLAEVYSQSSSAKEGGDLGFFELRLLAPQIRDAISNLSEGEFTNIIESDQGYQILYVEDIETTQGQPFEDAVSAIEEKLYTERMEEKFQAWLTELRKKAHIQIME